MMKSDISHGIATSLRIAASSFDEAGSPIGRSRTRLSVTFFFFFQAEDGIRDYKVTGVQTCALPILILIGGKIERLRRERRAGLGWDRLLAVPAAVARKYLVLVLELKQPQPDLLEIDRKSVV